MVEVALEEDGMGDGEVASPLGVSAAPSDGADADGGAVPVGQALQRDPHRAPGAPAEPGGPVGDTVLQGHVCLNYFHEGMVGVDFHNAGVEGMDMPLEMGGCPGSSVTSSPHGSNKPFPAETAVDHESPPAVPPHAPSTSTE